MAMHEWVVGVTLKFLYFFIPEVLIWIFIQKSANQFKFRFSSVEGYKHLRPFAKTWIVAVVILFITIFSQDIFELLFGQKVHVWLGSFAGNLVCMTLFLAIFSFLWVYNYLLEKDWDKLSWICTAIATLFIILFLVL